MGCWHRGWYLSRADGSYHDEDKDVDQPGYAPKEGWVALPLGGEGK